MTTCHSNRSSKGDQTGSNIGEVRKGFEGEGGEDKGQAPCVQIEIKVDDDDDEGEEEEEEDVDDY